MNRPSDSPVMEDGTVPGAKHVKVGKRILAEFFGHTAEANGRLFMLALRRAAASVLDKPVLVITSWKEVDGIAPGEVYVADAHALIKCPVEPRFYVERAGSGALAHFFKLKEAVSYATWLKEQS